MTMASAVRELLFACAVWNPSDGELERVRAAGAAGVDWDEWLWYVRWHRLVPHAARALGACGACGAAPGEILHALDAETRSIAARALRRTQQLAALIELLNGAGVRALPFKGPALSLAAYGDAGVRDSIDLDVVVRPRDVDAARDAMVRAGYASRTRMSPAQERMLQRSFGHFSYAQDGEAASVELHWRFASPGFPWSLPPDDVFARAIPEVLAGVRVCVPEPTDRVLLQAMHGARHQWERIEWLVAFRQLLRRGTSDHETLLARAAEHRSRRALGVALRLARDLLRAELPPRLVAVAEEAQAVSIAADIERGLASGDFPVGSPLGLDLRTMDGIADRVRYLAVGVFAPTLREWELVRLPDRLLPLYYPVRLARLAGLRVRSLFVRR
jgi:hypothetical protein